MEENVINIEIKDRFWDKVDKNESDTCWNWMAGTQSKGYGSFGIGNSKTALAHRVAYELATGINPKGFLCPSVALCLLILLDPPREAQYVHCFHPNCP